MSRRALLFALALCAATPSSAGQAPVADLSACLAGTGESRNLPLSERTCLVAALYACERTARPTLCLADISAWMRHEARSMLADMPPSVLPLEVPFVLLRLDALDLPRLRDGPSPWSSCPDADPALCDAARGMTWYLSIRWHARRAADRK